MKPPKKIVFVLAIATLGLAFLINFRDPEIFNRKLLNYDDHRYIQPMQSMSLHDYLDHWLPDRENYSFPVRDLTYLLDFKLEELTGYRTYWLSNFIYWLITMLIVYCLLELVLKEALFIRAVSFALIALHPINISMLQWATMRKHILVGLFLSWPTYKVAQLIAKRANPKLTDWLQIFGFYALACLSWPSAIFWILWPYWALRSQFKKLTPVKLSQISIPAILIFSTAYFMLVEKSGVTKHAIMNNLVSEQFHGVILAINSFGRGFFDWLFPFQIVEYYSLTNPFNLIGFGLLIVCIFLVLWLNDSKANIWFVLALIFLLPLAKLYVALTEFVWTARYLYLPLPYVTLGFALLIRNQKLNHVGKKLRFSSSSELSVLATCCVVFLYTLISWKTVPIWRDDLDLMKHCASTERSFKCTILVIEKTFDREGCVGLLPYLDPAKKRYDTQINLADFTFKADLPFYESYCFATEITTPPPEKLKRQEEIVKFYAEASGTAFATVLLHLQNQNKQAAWEAALKLYLNPETILKMNSEKVVDLLRGQTQALCELLSGANHDLCLERIAMFAYRYQNTPINPDRIQWAFNETIAAASSKQP